jgi:hypothetical protein
MLQCHGDAEGVALLGVEGETDAPEAPVPWAEFPPVPHTCGLPWQTPGSPPPPPQETRKDEMMTLRLSSFIGGLPQHPDKLRIDR